MTTVTLSDQAEAITALEKERKELFRESELIAAAQASLLEGIKKHGKRHEWVLERIIAIEGMQRKLVMPL